MPRWLAYAWPAPYTALGLLLGGLARRTGGTARWVDGVCEMEGPAVRWLLQHAVPLPGGAQAVTLGHVVLGRDRETLRRTRAHERVHVRQYERWGLLFVPAYAVASLLAWARGGHPYRDNAFERAARDGEAA